MAWRAVCKLLQRRSIDLLSHKNGCRLLVIGIFVTLVTLFQLGEVLVTWSTEKYAAMFNPFSDNIGSQSFRKRLCLPVPIDVVYTWVNGSDPLLVEELKAFKRQIKTELNLTTQSTATSNQCTFLHCVPAQGLVIEPPIPSEIELRQFGILYPAFREATEMFTVEDAVKRTDMTAVMFNSADDVEAAFKQKVLISGTAATMQQLYYTSDKTLINSVEAANTLIMSGFPYSKDEAPLLSKLTEKYESKNVASFTLYPERGVALLKVSTKEVYETVLGDKNMTANGKSITFSAARFIWDLRDYSQNEDISASRFEDNEELRYSLRSVEKYAPWVRHVFIVTNGQIPSWLNMDSPRLTVVTHEELFPNRSHLPTFSSPAIESHLHRIKGLSEKFIYLNDDVMFGKEVWPDDFYTEAGGQKVYLTWPVPNCQEGCPASWIKDGYCDKSCNNSECEWDGGDCVGSTALQPIYGPGQGHGSLWNTMSSYCNSGCANNWIADKYCDVACNVKQCGFDAGDCGIDNFHLLYRIDLHGNESFYSAAGHNPIYFDYSSLVPELDSIDEGFFDEEPIIRSMSIAQKFKVVTLVMNNNHSATFLNFSLRGKDLKSQVFLFNFTVLLDTTFQETPVSTVPETTKPTFPSASSDVTNESVEIPFVFIPNSDHLAPYAKYNNKSFDIAPSVINISGSLLPEDVKKEFDNVEKQYKDGDLTEAGYRRKISELWKIHKNRFHSVDDEPRIVQHMDIKSSKIKELMENNGTFLDHVHSQDAKEKKTLEVRKNALESVIKNPSLKKDIKKRRMNGDDPSNKDNWLGHLKRVQKKLNITQSRIGRTLLSLRLDSSKTLEEDPKDSSVSETDITSLRSSSPVGFLPWERLGIFSDLEQAFDRVLTMRDYLTDSRGKRRLLDTFANSLRHVSRVYNRAYGYTTRKVPAHIAHMVDKNIMAEMQMKFAEEWDETSSHRMRSSSDMQFAFGYFYYLMSEMKNVTIPEMFAELDADRSGVLSDREIRTMATRLFELPLELPNLVQLEETFINCSRNMTFLDSNISLATGVLSDQSNAFNKTFRKEVYYDKRMPQVTLELILRCRPLQKLLTKQMTSRTKYRFEIVGDDEVMFKMIRHNISMVVAQLDEVRKTPKKFICLNDNIDYSQDSAKLVKAVLRDFYESILPVPSRFELPREYRNKFLHIKDLKHWWYYRDLVRGSLYLLVSFLALFVLSTFVCDVRGSSRGRRIFRC